MTEELLADPVVFWLNMPAYTAHTEALHLMIVRWLVGCTGSRIGP
ncbi:MAG: hypothetical protein ABF449_04300 [Ethanoligenens sp.]